MTSSSQAVDAGPFKSRHQELAGVVKSVHARLRNNLRKCNGNYEKVWGEHCQDLNTLSEYATAMHSLATDIWCKQQPQTRIDWCVHACLQYFKRGGLHKVLDKDERRRLFQAVQASEPLKKPDGGNQEPRVNDKTCTCGYHAGRACSRCSPQCCWKEPAGGSGVQKHRMNSAAKGGPEDSHCNAIRVPFDGKIRLLDVGSCYNPFIHMQDFEAVAIDISPAVEFEEPLLSSQAMDAYIHCLCSPLETLPAQLFHVVVFSLLLEYLPSPSQRWTCCQKANKLLMQNGLLVIVTPDSHNQTRSAPWMQSWKSALESLGFKRWRYEKLQHLHCMAFRKVWQNQNSGAGKECSADLMYIPQDSNDAESLCEPSHCEPDPEEGESVCQFFTELPDLDVS